MTVEWISMAQLPSRESMSGTVTSGEGGSETL